MAKYDPLTYRVRPPIHILSSLKTPLFPTLARTVPIQRHLYHISQPDLLFTRATLSAPFPSFFHSSFGRIVVIMVDNSTLVGITLTMTRMAVYAWYARMASC